MSILKPGDRVVCKIKNSSIISTYASDFDFKKTFEIVALDKVGYHVYIPHYIMLNNTLTVDCSKITRLGINKKFLDEEIAYITNENIASIEYVMDGAFCSRCNEFLSQASPDKDGNMTCYACKNNRFR